MLRFIVFWCGAALMGLEMVAARVLAPYLGNSIYVWGAVISVVMVALSIGYALGGQIADRFGAARSLPVAIAGAGVFTTLAPLVAEAVLPGVAGLGARTGSLAAAVAIYFVPSLLLATVSPMGVRLAAREGMAHLGRSTGNLYAVSTAGSIVGTLGASFWLIPALSLEPLVVWTGVSLLLTALLALTLAPEPLPESAERHPHAARFTLMAGRVTLLLVLAGAIAAAAVLWRVAPVPTTNEYAETVLFRQDTQYHRITVTEGDGARHLRFDHSRQSAVMLDDPYVSALRYPNYVHLALAIKPDAARVLVIGLGGGTITKRFWRDYPEMTIDTVEIDPVVVDVARRYFWFPDDPRLRVFVEDGRRYVQSTSETYDLVIVDAYYSDSLPFHLTTQEFLTELKAVMAPDGVLAYNLIASVEGSHSDLFRSMYRTASSVWSYVYPFPIGIGSEGSASDNRNIIVLASDTRVPASVLTERIRSRVNGTVSIEGFEAMADDLYLDPVPVADVPLLTDAHAPVDQLIDVN